VSRVSPNPAPLPYPKDLRGHQRNCGGPGQATEAFFIPAVARPDLCADDGHRWDTHPKTQVCRRLTPGATRIRTLGPTRVRHPRQPQGSLLTPRWREMDSNHRYLARKSRCLFGLPVFLGALCQINLSQSKKPEAGRAITPPRLRSAIRSPPRLGRSAASIATRDGVEC